MKRFWKYNGLSVVLATIFIVCFVLQIVTGFNEHNKELQEEGGSQITMSSYLTSGHFIESTFENLESEFLQMGMFVILSAFFFQKGSSESKDPDETEPPEDIAAAKRRKDTPAPVKTGGAVLLLYKYSLSIALIALFLISFLLHWYGSLKDFNLEQSLKGEEQVSATTYLTHNRFWFESFQNWQSEFLAVLAIVVFTIFLRHEGSPQSKKITDPNSKTG